MVEKTNNFSFNSGLHCYRTYLMLFLDFIQVLTDKYPINKKMSIEITYSNSSIGKNIFSTSEKNIFIL